MLVSNKEKATHPANARYPASLLYPRPAQCRNAPRTISRPYPLTSNALKRGPRTNIASVGSALQLCCKRSRRYCTAGRPPHAATREQQHAARGWEATTLRCNSKARAAASTWSDPVAIDSSSQRPALRQQNSKSTIHNYIILSIVTNLPSGPVKVETMCCKDGANGTNWSPHIRGIYSRSISKQAAECAPSKHCPH